MKKNTFLQIFFFTCINIAHAADYTKEQLIDFALKYVRMESHYKDAEYLTDDADTYNTTLDAADGFPGEDPLTGHHQGLYVQMITYDFEWQGSRGYRAPDWNYGGGIAYGYSAPISSHLSFTLGVGDRGIWQNT